jgi:hypothetical protein
MQTWRNFQIMAMAKPKEVVSFFLFLFFFFLEALCHVPKVEKGGTTAKLTCYLQTTKGIIRRPNLFHPHAFLNDRLGTTSCASMQHLTWR